MRDIDVRKELKNSVLKKFYADTKSKVVNELPVNYGEAIVDIAVINGALHGYEIKSEYDTLARLPHQIKAYSKTFDYLTVIAAAKHLKQLEMILPEWVGIISIHNKKLVHSRKAVRNLSTENFSIAQLLWKEEAVAVLNEIGITKGVKSKSKPLLWSLIAETICKKDLSDKVRERLKLRVNWKSDQSLYESGGCFQLSSKL